MSSYFDSWDSEQREIKGLANMPARREAHRQHEIKLVRDVTVCMEWPGCPEDIRTSAYKVMLRWGVNSLPGCFGFSADNPDVESEEDEWRSVGRMSSDLHTIFHNLASLSIRPFTDNPLAPIRDLIGMGDERRLAMAKMAAGFVDPPDGVEGE